MAFNSTYTVMGRTYKNKADANQAVCDMLHRMDLSERAEKQIAETGFDIMYEVFGGLETAEEVEAFIAETFSEED